MCSCKENIEDKMPCKCKDNYEMGGSIDSERRFSESDYNRLIESTLFKGRWTGFVWEIYPFNGGSVLGKFNPKTKKLFIAGKKDKSNILVEWLQNNSYVSMDEYQKLEKGGIPDFNWDKYEEGGAVVNGFSLIYQKWSDIMGGNGVSGTIRTTPENYYVATINDYGDIVFDDIEAQTRNIDKKEVERLWYMNLIPSESKPKFVNGGTTEKLEKELRKLQRDLNSSRLRTYTEGDNSEEEMARIRERESKLARFNEVLRLLRESEEKYMNGGGIGSNKWQIKNADGEYFSSRLESGKPVWKDSPDMGYTFSKEEAEYVKQTLSSQIGLTDLEVIEYNPNWWKMETGGGIGFIPMDLEEKLAITAKWGGTDIKGVIGILNAMIDSGLTDNDLIPKSTKSGSAFQNAVEKKTKEIWNKIEPNYKGDFKGNMYYSTIKRLVERASAGDETLKKFKPFRKNQKFSDGGGVDAKTQKSELESKINHINNTYDGVNASKTYSDNRIQVISPYFNTLSEIKRNEFDGSGLVEKYGNTSSYVLYSNKSYFDNGGGVDSEIPKSELESMVGRSLNGWNDDIVYHNGKTYKKCFLKPYYKQI